MLVKMIVATRAVKVGVGETIDLPSRVAANLILEGFAERVAVAENRALDVPPGPELELDRDTARAASESVGEGSVDDDAGDQSDDGAGGGTGDTGKRETVPEGRKRKRK